MKRIIILLVILPMFFTGCQSYLDQDPEQLNTLEKVFSSRIETRKWFARIYSDDYFPNELFGAQYDHHYMFANDDACNLLDWHTNPAVLGSLSPANPVNGFEKNYFELFYQAIRHCNIFLENVDKCTELGVVERDRMVAEARFMRAMYHFWILRAYGPIPIIDKSIASNAAGDKIARNSMDECVKWICDEFDAAKPNMNTSMTANEQGFPTQGAVMAIKSRLLLMNASPLFNGNTVYSNWRNRDGKQLISQKYDAQKWKDAADAAHDVIALNYKLHKSKKTDPSFNDYVDNYREITTTWNEETIWARAAATSWWTQSCLPAVYQGWNARHSVTLELANDYFMADGSVAKPMNDWFTKKEFSTTVGNGTQANTFSMFVSREPRFYASNHFPNQRISYATTSKPDIYQTLEFWYSGTSGLSNSSGDRSSTGLSPRKNIPMNATSDKSEGTITSDPVPFPVIRLAEIYLNYCEAMNEYSGEASHRTILPYLNEIRERAGLGKDSYTGTYSQMEMREMIRHERRVELAWEVHRFFDVRRWFNAHGNNGLFNTPVHGLDVSRGKNATDPEFFTLTQAQIRIHRLEHYFLPIKASECAYNTDLAQAPFY